MSEQGALALAYSCRVCGVDLPYQGVGRPRAFCDEHRPSSFPPLVSDLDSRQELNGGGSRYVDVKAHRRRVKGDTSPLPRHRNTDPETSRSAARAVTGQGVEKAILIAFENHGHEGLTDDKLCRLLPERFAPTVKSARSRLARAGYLTDSGLTQLSDRGHPQIVWVLVQNDGVVL